jgi:hypothetical protein
MGAPPNGHPLMGIPVVISTNGLGLPVKQVASGACEMTVATNGWGIPIVLSDRGVPFIVTGGGTPTPTPTPSIPTPVIMQESAAGTTPYAISWADDPAILANMFIDVQRATGTTQADAKNNLTLGVLNGEAIQQLTEENLISPADIVLADMTATPTGVPIAEWVRFGHEDGLGGYVWGEFSNQVSDDIAPAASSAVLATTNSVNKSPYIDVTGSPALIAAVNNVIGSSVCVRTTTTAIGKKHLEVTINGIVNHIELGLIESTADLGGVNTNPYAGSSGKANGCAILFDTSTSTAIFANGATASGTTPALVAGDKIVFEFDNQTSPTSVPVNVWHRRSTTDTLIAALTLTSQIPTNLTFYGGGGSNSGPVDGWTVNFGATAFSKTVSSGYGPYG